MMSNPTTRPLASQGGAVVKILFRGKNTELTDGYLFIYNAMLKLIQLWQKRKGPL